MPPGLPRSGGRAGTRDRLTRVRTRRRFLVLLGPLLCLAGLACFLSPGFRWLTELGLRPGMGWILEHRFHFVLPAVPLFGGGILLLLILGYRELRCDPPVTLRRSDRSGRYLLVGAEEVVGALIDLNEPAIVASPDDWPSLVDVRAEFGDDLWFDHPGHGGRPFDDDPDGVRD